MDCLQTLKAAQTEAQDD